MKNKISLFLAIFTVSLFVIPQITLATSGACSYHGGVNCSAGRQSDGRVYCNDPNWTDSIVQYEFMEMCQSQTDFGFLIYEQAYYDSKAVDFIYSCPLHSTYKNPFNTEYCHCDVGYYNYEGLMGSTCDKGEPSLPSIDKTILSAIILNESIKNNNDVINDRFCNRYNGIAQNGTCQCQEGYRWRHDAYLNLYSCVVRDDIEIIKKDVPPKTNDQICQDSYLDSIWDGTYNDNNGLVCDCKSGYQWNQEQSSCVVIPKPKITTESSAVKKDKKSPEKADQQSSSNSSVSDKVKIGNSSSVFLNKDESITTKDVGTTTIERKIPERKSVWKRLKGFFGF